MDIQLLKTFIVETFNDSTNLRRAEEATQAEAGYQSTCDRPVSPALGVSEFENLKSSSDDATDADDDDVNSAKPKDRNDQAGTGNRGGPGSVSNADSVMSRQPFQPQSSRDADPHSSIHHESNILLQMIPYRPRVHDPSRSDRLIAGVQAPGGGSRSATHEVTNSARLLLDQWTISGSVPIADILDEEAAKEKQEASVRPSPLSDPRLADIIPAENWPDILILRIIIRFHRLQV